MNLKIIAIYMMEYFEMELIDSKFSKNNFPILDVSMSKVLPIEVRLTLHDWYGLNG